MHLPKFEQMSALKHHCGVCKTPFTNPSSLSTCIGKHEVICQQYHLMFHFVGKAHTCKSCTRQETQQRNRHRDIVLLIRKYHVENGDSGVVMDGLVPTKMTDSMPPSGINKESNKPPKSTRRNYPELEIVRQCDYAQLFALVHGNASVASDADVALAEALAVNFLPNVFSEERMLDTLMAPPRNRPDLIKESNRVITALRLTKPATKGAAAIVSKIRAAIQEDIDITWNTEVEMKKRRLIYAQWVTQGAVSNMAQHYEDWDLETGARKTRRWKGDVRGAKDEINPSSDDFDRLDDLDAISRAIPDVSGLPEAQRLEAEMNLRPEIGPATQPTCNDNRRDGVALPYVNRLESPRVWAEENYAATPVNTTPTIRIIKQASRSKENSWATPPRPRPIDLSVKPPDTAPPFKTVFSRPPDGPLSSEPPSTNPWFSPVPCPDVRSPQPKADTFAKIEDLLHEPLVKMASSVKVVAKPPIVDQPLEEGWTKVVNKRGGGKKKK